jgi:hypothetical protein
MYPKVCKFEKSYLIHNLIYICNNTFYQNLDMYLKWKKVHILTSKYITTFYPKKGHIIGSSTQLWGGEQEPNEKKVSCQRAIHPCCCVCGCWFTLTRRVQLSDLKNCALFPEIKMKKTNKQSEGIKNQNPSRYYYNSITNLKFQHKPKYHLSKILI